MHLVFLDPRGSQDHLAAQVSLGTPATQALGDLMETLDSRDLEVILAARANQGLQDQLVPKEHREQMVRKVLLVQLDLRDSRGKLEILVLEVTQDKPVKLGLGVTLGHLVCKAHKDLVDLPVMRDFKVNLGDKGQKETLVLRDHLVLKVILLNNSPFGSFRKFAIMFRYLLLHKSIAISLLTNQRFVFN